VEAEALVRAVVDGGLQGVRELQAATERVPGRISQRTSAFQNRCRCTETENATNPPIPQFLPARDLLMNFNQVQILSSNHKTSQPRAWAQTTPNAGYRASPLIIEWRAFDPLNLNGAEQNALQLRIEALVRLLQGEPKPSGFRVLGCLGYLEDKTNSRFGLVFRYPPDLQQP